MPYDAFDGISHPPRLVTDTTRKAQPTPAPVDTVALKGRIAGAQNAVNRYATDTGPAAPTIRAVAADRLTAKTDTLAKVRAGKIPAKKGG